jgi:hypothetical protein
MNRREFFRNFGCIAACGAVAGRVKTAGEGNNAAGSGRTLNSSVCVVGAGPAGFVAAIAAARQGAKVTLVESLGFAGGMATAGLVGPISKFNFAGKRVVGALPWEFVERLAARGGAITDLQKGNVPFEAEIYRRVAGEMLEEAGVTCLWQTSVCGAPELAADGSIKSITLSTAGFLSKLEADVFIDCSAAGALVGYHGFGGYRSEKGAAQPLSLCFHLGGVDTDKARVLVRRDDERSRNPILRAALEKAMQSGRIKSFGGPWAVWGSTIRKGSVSVNATRTAADVTDPVEIAGATALMRREIHEIVDIFRAADPAFADSYVIQTAAITGFRECRELKAMHRITAAEFVSQENYPDTIALAAHPIDRHLAGSSAQNLSFLKKPGAIPLRSLISAKCPNLLAAGGLIAAEPAAFASIRVQAQCMATGEAAGVTAAMAAKSGTAVQKVDPRAVVATLASSGAILSFG